MIDSLNEPYCEVVNFDRGTFVSPHLQKREMREQGLLIVETFSLQSPPFTPRLVRERG